LNPLAFHGWREEERAIPRRLLKATRFAGRIRGFTGFTRGGDRGFVIAESGIDALSYAVLHPDTAARYASTGGTMNPNQPALLRAAIEKMGQGARLVIATGNDPGGRALADQIEALARETGREDLCLVRDLPAGEGTHWNDLLRATCSGLQT
jgi:hypothetical protein